MSSRCNNTCNASDLNFCQFDQFMVVSLWSFSLHVYSQWTPVINKIFIWYLKTKANNKKTEQGFPNLWALDWNLLSDSGGIRVKTNIEYWIPFPMCISCWISSCVKCLFKPLVRFLIWLAPFSHWFVQVLYSFCIPFFVSCMYWIYIFSIYEAFISLFSDAISVFGWTIL